jgi:hypothetical protein
VGICHGDGGYTGGGYSFPNRKKRADEEESAGKDCKPADTLYLENGRKFSISGLKEEVVLNLVDHLKNGTSSEVDSSLFEGLVQLNQSASFIDIRCLKVLSSLGQMSLHCRNKKAWFLRRGGKCDNSVSVVCS